MGEQAAFLDFGNGHANARSEKVLPRIGDTVGFNTPASATGGGYDEVGLFFSFLSFITIIYHRNGGLSRGYLKKLFTK